MPTSKLQREIRQTRPFESDGQEAYLNLLRTQGVLSAPFAALFRQHGVSESTYNVLRILRGAGEPVPTREIGRRLVARVPDVTRLVDRLEASGLVARSRSADDRRVVHVGITREGRELLRRLDRPVRDLSERAFAHLAKGEVRKLITLLEKARNCPTPEEEPAVPAERPAKAGTPPSESPDRPRRANGRPRRGLR